MENEVFFKESKLTGAQRAGAMQNPQPLMVRIVMKYSGGMISDEKIAQQFLVAVAVLFLLISLIIVFKSRGPNFSETRKTPQPSGNFVE